MRFSNCSHVWILFQCKHFFFHIVHFICHLATLCCAVEREYSTHGTRMWSALVCVCVYESCVRFRIHMCVCVRSPIQIEIECFVLKT